MNGTEDESNIVFQGQLYQGEAKSKSWSAMCSGQVTVYLQQMGGSGGEGSWQLVAFKGEDKVWEGCVDAGFKHRVRESFVQWQQRGSEGVPETYALRLKNKTAAQQFSEAITAALTNPVPKPKPAEELVKLKLLRAGQEPTIVSVPKHVTISQLLKRISQRHQLDPSQHAIALPPDTPHGQPVLCTSFMTVGSLNSQEIHLVKREAAQPSAERASSKDGAVDPTLLLHIDLPKDERTVVRVSPSLTLKELLQYVCEKRNLDLTTHCFDLPATEESLAGKTLGQLKINNVTVISKESKQSPSKTRKTSVKAKNKVSEKSTGSPKTGRRQAPPPPPPQRSRTQPELMRQLTAEMVDRKLYQQSTNGRKEDDDESGRGEGVQEEGSTQAGELKRPDPNPTNVAADDGGTLTKLRPRGRPAPPPPEKERGPTSDSLPASSRGSEPPPVAEKPKRKADSRVQDEPDCGPPPSSHSQDPSSINNGALDLSGTVGCEEVTGVIGVKGKVKEHAERPEISDVITEGLKKQTEGMGRYQSIKRRKAPESPGALAKATPTQNSIKRSAKQPSGSPHPQRERSDSNTTSNTSPPAPQKERDESNAPQPQREEADTKGNEQKTVKRKPRGPAPPPPKPYAVKMKEELETKSKTVEEQKKLENSGGRTPTRPRPSRPAPSRPPLSTLQKKDSTVQTRAKVSAEPPSQKQESGSSPAKQDQSETQEKTEPPASSVSSTSSTPPSPGPSPAPSPGLSPNKTRRPSAVAIVDEKEDGRKVLIVKPSPHAERRPTQPTALVFNLPPPPPPPELDQQPTTKEEAAENTGMEEQELLETIVERSSEEREVEEKSGKEVAAIEAKPSDKGIVVDENPDEPTAEGRPPDEPMAESRPPDELMAEGRPPDELMAESRPPDELMAEGRPPDELMVESRPPDELMAEGRPPDELMVESRPPDELVAESRKVSDVLSPAKSSLDETILSNEYTNLDDSSSSEEQTTDFSCEDNLDPIEDTKTDCTDGTEKTGLIEDAKETGPTEDTMRTDSTEVTEKTDSIKEDTLNTDPTDGINNIERNDPIKGTVGNNPTEETESNSTEGTVRGSIEDILRSDSDSSAKEKTTDADLEEGSDTSSEGGSGSSASDSDTVCGYNVGDGSPVHSSDHHTLPPPMPEDLPSLTLNANANNNNIEWTEVADFLPPPTEFSPPLPKLTETAGDEEEEEGVVLLSMVKHREDLPVIPIGVEDVIKRPDNVQEKPNEEEREEDPLDERKESIGSKLNELDTMVTSLQKLITEATGSPPPSPPHPPPPPPPPSHPTPASPKKSSSLPPKPKPPPVKWRPPKQQPDPDTAKEELFAKLKERQKKLQAHAEAESTAPPTVDPHSRLSTTQAPGEMVQLQLQYLQQQVLQQQMMQLQWQQMQQLALQQNTGMMLPSINQAFLPPAALPTAPLLGVQHPPVAIPQSMIQPTAMVGSTAQPMQVAGFVPMRAHPQAVVQQPTSSLPQLQFPQGIVQPAIPPAYSIPPGYTAINPPTNLPPTASTTNSPPPTSSPPSSSTPPPPPPPTSSPPPLISSSEGMSPSQTGQNSGEQTPHASDCQKPTHQDLRSMALGEVEDQFDSLMVEMRDTDPNEVLRKVPTEELNRDTPSYTGMAAALAEALKQRRMHFTEKRRSKDLDESHCSEWGSP